MPEPLTLKRIIADKFIWVFFGLVVSTWYARFYPFLPTINAWAVYFFCGICLFRLVLPGRRCRWKYLVGGLLLAGYLSFLTENFFYNWVDIWRIRANFSEFERCKASGVALPQGHRLSVCERDDRWWRYDLTRVIIYDSSDNVLLPQFDPTSEWRRAAVQIAADAPFGIVGFTAKRLSGHFFLVDFSDDLSPNVSVDKQLGRNN
jgi:hypothetical protein